MTRFTNSREAEPKDVKGMRGAEVHILVFRSIYDQFLNMIFWSLATFGHFGSISVSYFRKLPKVDLRWIRSHLKVDQQLAKSGSKVD